MQCVDRHFVRRAGAAEPRASCENRRSAGARIEQTLAPTAKIHSHHDAAVLGMGFALALINVRLGFRLEG
jgi:hypothetical protein